MKKLIILALVSLILSLAGCGANSPAASGGGGGGGGGTTAPTIISMSPTSGPVGSVVTITGTNFSTAPANNIVKFNGTVATVASATATSISVNVPANASTGAITVTIGTQTVTSATNFTVTTVPAPAAPTGVSATASGSAQININWTLVSGATGYNIYRSTAPNVAISTSNKLTATPVTAGPYGNTGLAAGTTYYYKVTAVNANGESAGSTEVNATTASALQSPAAPTGVTATASGSDQINVDWTLVNGATGYNIYRSTSPNVAITQPNLVNTAGPVAAGPYGNTGLTAGTTYYYKVTAVNANGESAGSTEVNATTASAPQSPAAPTGVTATASGSDQINVDWTLVNGATGYNIYRSTSPNVAITQPNLVNTAGPVAAGPYGNTGLTAGTTYYYKVTAVNANGESAGSAEVNATTASAPQAPAAPTGVTATASGSDQINVDWTLVNGATGYNIYRSTAPNVAVAAANLVNTAGSVAAGPYGNTGLTAGTTYYYKVTAVNANGESAGSAEVSAATIPSLAAPTGVTATAINSGRIDINWNLVNGATGYSIYRSTSPNVSITAANHYVDAAGGPISDTGVSPATTYYYKVTAFDANGESAGSAEAGATTPALPAAPTGVTATGEDGQVSMNWTAGAGATSYKVYRSTTPGVTPQNAPNINSFASSYTPPYIIWGLTNGTRYYFVVTVVDANNQESAPSAEVSATPAAAPTGVTATAISSTEIDINWTNAAGATGYNIYRATAPNVVITAANKITATPVTAGTYANTGLTAGTTYYYKVTSVYPNNVEAPSAEVSAATFSPPAAPVVTATADHSQNIITWSAVSGATSYNIYWSTAPGVTKANGTKITGATTPYFHGGLTPGTPYYYVVTAVNANGESIESAQVTATPIPNGVLGVDWTTRGRDTTYYGYTSIAYSNGKYVTFGQSPAPMGQASNVTLSSSTDGFTWTPSIVGSTTTQINGKVVSGNGVFVADVSSNIFSSVDGVNWTMPALGTANSTFYGLSFANGKFYIFENDAATAVTTLHVSTDGVNWTPYTGAGIPPVGSSVGAAEVSFGNGIYVFFENFGGTYTDIWTSADGISWTRQPGAGAGGYRIAFGNGKFLLLSKYYSSSIYASVDGVTWTNQPMNANTTVGDMIFANGQFIAVGNEYINGAWPPVILTSPDGVTFTKQSVADAAAAGTGSLSTISSGLNQFVATDGAYFVTSP